MATNDTYGELIAQLPEELRTSLDELARQGAQRMLAAALEADVARYIERHQQTRDTIRTEGRW